MGRLNKIFQSDLKKLFHAIIRGYTIKVDLENLSIFYNFS
jgi:hypothetical protein